MIAAVAVAALVLAAPPAFRTPSGNIGCLASGAALRCDVLGGLRPKPRRRCELDWTGLVLGTVGRAQPECAGDTVVRRRARVLAYGRTWRNGSFACTSRRAGLTCANRLGRGFFLARGRWRVF